LHKDSNSYSANQESREASTSQLKDHQNQKSIFVKTTKLELQFNINQKFREFIYFTLNLMILKMCLLFSSLIESTIS
jgi:hypothetical protein